MLSRSPLASLLASALCVAGTLAFSGAVAGDQADRAVAAVRKLVASGQIPAGTRLHLGFKQGNVNAFLGNDLTLQKEWESLTGIVLDTHLIPQQPIRETLNGNPDIDIAVARNHEYPDLLADGMILELGPLPPGITDAGRNYNFTLPLFAQGKVFATLNTISAARLFNSEGSAVRGTFMVAPLPGSRIDGRLVRHNTLIYGNNLVIPKTARNPHLAFLYAMWLTDPDVSTRSIGTPGGFADPYRWNHLRDARIRRIYTPEALAIFSAEWAVTLPAGTGLRGDAQYLAELDRNLTAAARGEIDAREAMRRTGTEWEQITDQLGRAEQIRQWQALRRQSGDRR